MSNHISEELPLLLTGEASRDTVLDAAEHLRVCPDCQQELVSAVVAHASLSSAHRFAPDMVTRPTESADDGDLGAFGGLGELAHRRDDSGAPSLPDMSAMFQTVRDEAASSRSRLSGRRRLLSVAAAAVVLTGGGLAIAETVGSSSTSSSSHTVALSAYGIAAHENVSGTVTLADDTMKISATSLPKLTGDRVYEVWLTAAIGSGKLPVGLMTDNRTTTLAVPSTWLKTYSGIQVSVQPTNQVDTFSGQSVLRGTYS